MEYTLVDIYGSTLDVFEDLPAARESIAALLREDPMAADDLLVLSYAEGQQVGAAVAAPDFVAPAKAYFAQLIASYLIDWSPQIELTLPQSVDPEADFEIEWEAEEQDSDVEALFHGQRLVLC